MDRTACVIAAGVWDGKRALLKNRDRKYTPRSVIVRDRINGVEVAYMRDLVTNWCEGINEHGIGLANAALAVGLDEAEGSGEPSKAEEKADRKSKSFDGERVLKALGCVTLEDAIQSVCEHLGGLEGHTFVSSPDRAVSIELIEDDCVVKDLTDDEVHVRTNHGRDTGGTGYTDGEGYLASAARKERSIQVLRKSLKPTDLGPDLMKARTGDDPKTPNNPVRDTGTMATSSQLVMNLTDREIDFFVIPGKMDYDGLDDRLPKSYKPKIKVRVFSYRDGGKELVELSPSTGTRKKSVEPVKLASQDPLTPIYQDPDAISKADIQTVFGWLRDLGDQRDQVGIDFNRLADWMSAKGGYTIPRTVFRPVVYSTFYDWFLRTPTPETLLASRMAAAHGDLCSPVEGKVEYTGTVGDGLIQLKMGKANVLEALRHLEPDIGSHEFVKLSLFLHDCHRVYAPVTGTVAGVHRFNADTDPFGKNNVTAIELDTRFGRVFLCCIGELTIQDFQCGVTVGDTVRAVDEIGHFQWGSMVLVTYPPELNFVFNENEHPVFIGDPIAVLPTSGRGGFRYPHVDPVKLAARHMEASTHDKSIALMKFLSGVARRNGAGKHIYVVGGAVRNYLLGVPIKDIDVVVDSVELGKDSEWFAKEVAKAIPVPSNLTTNQYGVAILTVKGDWILDGINMKGEVIEVANARKESYEGAGGKGKGYKPTDVSPANIREDVYRREFTFNTLLWRLLDLADGPEKAEVIDITGLGRQHLEEKLISTPVDPDKTFSDDPTRQLRILKFLLRYNLKISPDVVASVKRNAHKLKDMPWEAVGNILVGDILESPKAMEGLKVMKSLGMLDVLVEMIRETPAFAAYMTRQLSGGNHPVELLLELAEIGFSDKVLGFLTPAQRSRFREVITGMPGDESRRFLEVLKKPPVDSMALFQEFNIQGKDRGILVPMAREILLAEPNLVTNEVGLNDHLRKNLRMTRTADLTPPRGVNRVVDLIWDDLCSKTGHGCPEPVPPMSCGVPMNTLASHVAARFLQAKLPNESDLPPGAAEILHEVENLEALSADIEVILDTYENTVPMPQVGRIAAITLMSQQECFAKCEHALRHAERVINMARAYLQSNPGDPDVSLALRDSQTMYERFESFRARSREMLSAMSQKIMPTELKDTVSAVMDGVRAVLNVPNRLTVVVSPRFVPCEVRGRPVDGMVFDAFVTAYPLPEDVHPKYQQFVFSQATMGDDLNLYLVAIDRIGSEAPTKPVIVGALKDAVVQKILGFLKGWTNLKG